MRDVQEINGSGSMTACVTNVLSMNFVTSANLYGHICNILDTKALLSFFTRNDLHELTI